MGNLYYENLENGSSNNKFTNHVVISLKDFMDMNGEIEKLKYEKIELNHKYENLERFLKDVHLPGEIIADGRVKNMDWYIEHNAIERETTYKVAVTVFDEDVKKYGY